jgi:hypothetical protein
MTASAIVKRPWLLLLGGMAGSLLLFAGLLWFRLFCAVGFELRYDIVFTGILLALFFYGLRWVHANYRPILLSFVSVGICALVLVGVWESKVSDLSLMAGIFPVSDSASYMDASYRLMNTGALTDVASRRPIAPAIGGVVLFFTQGNVHVYLAVLVFVVALVMAWGAHEVMLSHGLSAGYVVFLGQFLFYRRFIGTVLTEHVGFALGIVAFGMIWRAFHLKSRQFCFGGIFVLTIGLCARAGAFFVLPALALWGGLYWRGAAVFCIATFTLLCAAILAGFGVHMLLAGGVGTAEKSFGNFSYVLYGVLHGGDWTQVQKDHPYIYDFPETNRNAYIYDLCRKRLRAKPSSILTGGLRAVSSMLISFDGPFSFVFFANQRAIRNWPISPSLHDQTLLRAFIGNPWKYFHMLGVYAVYFLFWLLAIAGIVVLIRKRDQPSSLLLFSGLGIVSSAPFAPPWDCDLIRVYAATVPFFLAYPAVAIHALFRHRFGPCSLVPETERRNRSSISLLVFAWVVIPLVCLSPLAFRYYRVPMREGNLFTQAGFPLQPQGIVRLDDRSCQKYSAKDLILRNRGVLTLARPDYMADLLSATEFGSALAMVYDHESDALRYITYDPVLEGTVILEHLSNQEHGLWWMLQPLYENHPH